MELNLKGKVVIVTGGASGIGKSIAYEFLKEGAIVSVCDIQSDKLNQAKEEFGRDGYTLHTKICNVCDYDSFCDYAEEVFQTFGRIDIFVNNVGCIKRGKALCDTSLDELMWYLKLNLISSFFGCKIAAKYMKQTGGGVILNAASFAALDPIAGSGCYGMSKAAVLSMTRVLAAELAKDNIRVVAYVPGLIATELTAENIRLNGETLLRDIPVRRFGTPEDIGRVVVFVASDAGSYINGTHVEISGGKRCVQNPWYSYTTN